MPVEVENFLATHKPIPQREEVEWELGSREFEQAKNFVLRSLGKKNQTSHELRAKLTRKNFSENTIKKISTWLEEYSLVDNQKFAQASLQTKLLQGKGSLAFCQSTRNKLKMKEQQQALAKIHQEEWLQAAQRAKNRYLKRYNNPEMTPEFRQKLYRHLASRGFSHPIISKAIAQ